jgi:hypothetical protein
MVERAVGMPAASAYFSPVCPQWVSDNDNYCQQYPWTDTPKTPDNTGRNYYKHSNNQPCFELSQLFFLFHDNHLFRLGRTQIYAEKMIFAVIFILNLYNLRLSASY